MVQFKVLLSTLVVASALTSTTVLGCNPVSLESNTDMCIDAEEVISDFSIKARACGSNDDEKLELKMSLANGMFLNCQTQCLYNVVGESPSTFKYSKAGKCWQKKKGRKCRGAATGEDEFGAQRKADFCSIARVEPAQDEACQPMKIEFTTDNIALCPADVQFSPNTVACNPEHTGDVLIAVANGMFGFVEETASKDCSATCLYSAVNTFSYRWNDNTMCWDKLSGYSSCNRKDKHERNAAKLHKSSLCAMSAPPTTEVELPGGAETAPEPEVEIDMPCTQVRNELTLDFMDGLCGHEEPCNPIDNTCISNTGANRGPTAVGCDPEDTHNVLLSLANGLFGGNSGNERNCGAHCLFDYITPFNTAYKWDSMSMCWSRKKGNTDKCGGATERDYAVGRQSSLCPPTQAPTLSPSFTMSPTKQPTDSPTTSTPTVSPSVSPTSSSPTAFPTTSKPTVSPTMSPSLSPTPSPTISPTVYCIQFNHSLSTDIVQEFCGESIECQGDSCKSELGAEFGPDARACSEKDQDRLELSIANGMFGGADGQARNCDSFCVWDHLKPKKRSYKWDGKKQCWKRKNAKCYANDKAEKVFAFDRRELFCTVKDADQQIDYGEDEDVVDDTKRHHRVRLATVAYDAKLTKPVLGVAVFGFTITLSAIGAVVMSRRRTSQRTLIAAQETAV